MNEEIVISGISCRLPESNNMEEFLEHLLNGDDLVTEDNRRWEPGLFNLPRRNGKLKDIASFDAEFFNMNADQANSMDPQLRLGLEVTYEAICDAGILPESLRGSNTGVFVGGLLTETSEVLLTFAEKSTEHAALGSSKTMFANRISYEFDLRGPSITVDTACSSSLLAMQLAMSAIRRGQCDRAIVAGLQVILIPTTDVQFLKMGMLSPKGMCQSFDEDGDGYVRSEGVCTICLQKRFEAKRIYATLVHAKCNTDGYKDQGVTFPSSELQAELCKATYAEAGIDPRDVVYVEAHGTGTKAGDPQEANGIAKVFCKPGREGPLLIGSVKSSMGHAEPTSGLAGVAKMVNAMESGILPRNLHFRTPNANIPGLIDGRMKVVTENTAWGGGLVGINSFGFGGSNVHAILRFDKVTGRGCTSSEESQCSLPRLVLCSARTAEGLRSMLSEVERNVHNSNFLDLLAELSLTPTKLHPYRGYELVNVEGSAMLKMSTSRTEEVRCATQRPVWFVYSGVGSQWQGMAKDLLSITMFRETFRKCSDVLAPFGLDIFAIISEASSLLNDFESVILITAIQLALTDLLLFLGVKPDGLIGHSIGEVACGYADGCLSFEQAMLVAYWRAKCVDEANLPAGMMAATGLSWPEALDQCPQGVFPACFNSETSVTISGESSKVEQFVNSLKSENIFAKIVETEIPYHSPILESALTNLEEELRNLIPVPAKRSGRWRSSTFPETSWDCDPIAGSCSARYHVENLRRPVLFHQCVRQIPDNAVVIEVSPDCILQAILKSSLSSQITLGLQSRKESNNLEYFLHQLGKVYEAGINVDVRRLYKTPNFPVPSGTPMIGSRISWNHAKKWFVANGMEAVLFRDITTTSKTSCTFSIDPYGCEEDSYLLDYVIDGVVTCPTSSFLVLVWRGFVKLLGEGADYLKTSIRLTDFTVKQQLFLDRNAVSLDITILPVTGMFTIMHDKTLVATGKISAMDASSTDSKMESNEPMYPLEQPNVLTDDHVYDDLTTRGYEFGDHFRAIASAAGQPPDVFWLQWSGCWVQFLEGMFQTLLIQPDRYRNELKFPSRIENIVIDPSMLKSDGELVETHFVPTTKQVMNYAVKITDITWKYKSSSRSASENKLSEAAMNAKATRDCDKNEVIPPNESFVTIGSLGDLDTLQWTNRGDGTNGRTGAVRVHFASVNSRDLIEADGQTSSEHSGTEPISSDDAPKQTFGLEVSGIIEGSNQKVMALVPGQGLSTSLPADSGLIWEVPPTWNLEEAASVPLAYAVAYYALIVRGQLSSKDTILIHNSCSDIGIASITVAQTVGAKLFATVSSEHQKSYLINRFPNMTSDMIWDINQSGLITFILKSTNGRGVSALLSFAFANNQMDADVKCLAKCGTLLHVGQADFVSNAKLAMAMFMKSIGFHGIVIEDILRDDSEDLQKVQQFVAEGIQLGVIQPLPIAKVFPAEKVGNAFKFLSQCAQEQAF